MWRQIWQRPSDDSNLSAEIPHGHANDSGECLGHWENLAQLGRRNTFWQNRRGRRGLTSARNWVQLKYKILPLPKSWHGHSKVHVPALGGKGEHEVLLYPTDQTHDGEHAVVNLEVVAEKGNNEEALDGNMNTLECFCLTYLLIVLTC